MKKGLALFLASLLVCCLCSCAAKYYDAENISEIYDREWIIGKTRSEIQQRYGAFDREFTSDDGKDLGAYYVNYDNNIFDPSHIHDTYFIVFNGENVAVEAYFAQTSIGG